MGNVQQHNLDICSARVQSLPQSSSQCTQSYTEPESYTQPERKTQTDYLPLCVSVGHAGFIMIVET